MAEIGSAFLSILPSAKGFGSKLEKETSRQSAGVGKRVGAGFGKAFSLGAGVLAAAGVASFLKDSVAGLVEHNQTFAITAQVIKTTGGAANVTADEVGNLADALERKTGVDGDAILSGQNMLLTFTNLRNEVGKGNNIFDRATSIITDMSVALGSDTKTSAIQVGKALNDPIKGVSALSKVGVSFTEQQKEQIKTLVKSGNTLDAQKIILGELGKEFGGAALAAKSPTADLVTAFHALQDQVGALVLPSLTKLAQLLADKVVPAISATVDGLSGVSAILFKGDFAGAAKTFGFAEDSKQVDFLFRVRDALLALGKAAKYVGGIIKDQVEVRLHLLGDALHFVQPLLDKVGDFMRNNPGTVKVFAAALATLVGVIGAITVATTLFSIALNSTGIPLVIIGIAALAAGLYYAYQNSEQFRSIVNQVGASLKQFAVFVKTQAIPFLTELATTIAAKLKPILTQLGETFRTSIQPTITKAVAKFREMQPALQRIFVAAQQVLGVVIKVAAKFVVLYATVLGKVIPVLIQVAGFILSKAVPAITAYIGVVVKIIDKMISFAHKVAQAAARVVQFANAVRTGISGALSAVRALPDRIASALSGLANQLYSLGKTAAAKLGQGIADGITSKIGDVTDAVGNMFSAIARRAPGSPVKEGPLKSWNHGNGVSGAGRKLGQGIADGIAAKRKAVIAAITKVVDGIKAAVDKIKSQISSVKDTMRGLASSVADAFKPDLFGGNLADLFTNGTRGTLDLKRLKTAFLKLRKFGLSPAFLSSLFASGNTDLILQLAQSGKGSARSAQSLFAQTNSLSSQLGNAVGTNQFGDELRGLRGDLRDEMRKLRLEVAKLPKGVGKEINHAATRGRREARA